MKKDFMDFICSRAVERYFKAPAPFFILPIKTTNALIEKGGRMETQTNEPVFDNSIAKKWERHELAAKILCSMVAVPENKELDFDTMADFATRYADALIKKLNEPEL